MTLPDGYRREFAEPVGYVDFASIGPVSHRVRAAVDAFLLDMAAPHSSVGQSLLGIYEKSLATVARFLSVPPEQVTVAPSTSAPLFHVAFGLLDHGGNVVVPAREFPANLYPWLRAEALGGPEVRLVDVPDGRLTPDALRQAIDAETRAVAVSLVDATTGFRVDVDAMADVAGDALLVVDAVQALGAVEQVLPPADLLVAGGQKFLRAGIGNGVAAISARAMEMLDASLSGWWSVESPFDTDDPAPHELRDDAERLHVGSPSIGGAVAAAAAVDLIEVAGIAAIERAVLDIASAVEATLEEAGAEISRPWRSSDERSAIVSFRLPGEAPATTHQRLADAGVIASLRGAWVRLSVHATTQDAVTGLLAEAL